MHGTGTCGLLRLFAPIIDSRLRVETGLRGKKTPTTLDSIPLSSIPHSKTLATTPQPSLLCRPVQHWLLHLLLLVLNAMHSFNQPPDLPFPSRMWVEEGKGGTECGERECLSPLNWNGRFPNLSNKIHLKKKTQKKTRSVRKHFLSSPLPPPHSEKEIKYLLNDSRREF